MSMTTAALEDRRGAPRSFAKEKEVIMNKVKVTAVACALAFSLGCAQVSGPVGKAGDAVTNATEVTVDFVNKAISSGVFDSLKAAGKAIGDLVKVVGELLAPAAEAPPAPPAE